ncbi:hydrogen peroxide-dependent heme synthase [uncultured Gimesia sp.]|uniref:hydrogen peroxide-dependent heme synthase n=1 Tax=uncultured Gimesia sp. TaxID=1678688 RepID=UPI002629ABF6|nr:hydrogen peroxide-dependent heme synthase [uncultured Gimesia sp.]
MNRPPHSSTPMPDPTTRMTEGWHCLHLYYRVDQGVLNQIDQKTRAAGRETLATLLNPDREDAPVRIQSSIVSGHKADLQVLVMDPDPIKLDSIQQAIRACELGPALIPTYSFVSITEISEYVPTLEQYTAKLKQEGTDPESPAFQAKLKAYESRLPAMNQQRIYPEFPDFPVCTFYPMNKSRVPGANWYMEQFSNRYSMMAEHGLSGMKFAGRVVQVITASTGFDDWEWGVTLWGRAPEPIKEIVYTMRFDKASAKYAEFGPFYLSYIMTPEAAIAHLKL